MFMTANNYQATKNFENFGYQLQYTRNNLQVNQGPRVGQNDLNWRPPPLVKHRFTAVLPKPIGAGAH